METSILISQLLGSVYVLVGLGMFISKEHYSKLLRSFKDSPSLLYLGGILAFVIGFLILKYHWVWAADWRSLITLIGVFACLKGVLLLLIPNKFVNLFKDDYLNLARWAALGLGVVFCCLGYLS